MRNGTNKHLTREEINRRFRDLSESDEDLLTTNSRYEDYCAVIDRHKDAIIKNFRQRRDAEV